MIHAGTRVQLSGRHRHRPEVRQVSSSELLAHLHAKHQAILDTIRTSKDIKTIEDDLKSVLAAFASNFA